MSALLHIKNLIITNLTCETELKDAIMGVLNNIDTDLNVNGYETSHDTDEAIAYLDQVLVGEDEEEVAQEQENEEEEDEEQGVQ